jgi:hypothetical protein
MHDPLLVQFTAETVSELGGNAELVLSRGLPTMRSSISKSVKSSSPSTSHDSSPSTAYEDVKSEDNNEKENLLDPEKNVSQLHCDSNCRCVCHTTQKLLPDNLGMKRQNSSSCLIAQFVRACTLKACKKKRRRSKGSFAVPSQVLNKAIGVRLLLKGFNHLFFLKAYNAVSENSDQIRYATSGNLQGLVVLVRTKKATINDTGPDGWTLLHVRNSSSSLQGYAYINSLLHTGGIFMLSHG